MAQEIPLAGFISSSLITAGTSAISGGGSLGMFRPQRSIGGIVATITIEESTRDDMEITRHPIETGAPITDHAFVMPAEVIIRAAWTDSGSGPGYSRAAYAALLNLRAQREPFTVITGKRTLPNMLIGSIAQVTDERSENALAVVLVCRQVIIVDSATVKVAPKAAQASPATTAQTTEGGGRQATDATPAQKSSANRSFLGHAADFGNNVSQGLTNTLKALGLTGADGSTRLSAGTSP